MLTYDMTKAEGPLYLYLYDCIKKDISEGNIKAHERMPSKRVLAGNLGISTITVENAYEQLISEGYLYSEEKKGYFAAKIATRTYSSVQSIKTERIDLPTKLPGDYYDFSANHTEPDNFPFSVWARLARKSLSDDKNELLESSFCGGIRPLREAIADHLASFRGMNVDPDQIVIGAGTEYLYSLIVKLLGRNKTYCLADPGYKKTGQIYKSCGAKCVYVGMDEQGIKIDTLNTAGADIVHISPTHQFPTGITTPVSRRYELLTWADQDNRYIIEDDYDSEFRLKGRPIPSLQSIDTHGKVIYLNTFSKSLTSTIRVSYMVLPENLAEKFYKELSFYSCTVSTFEQYILSHFIKEGYFEKHINRMRIYYAKKRKEILDTIAQVFSPTECSVIEKDTGLHFLLKLNTDIPDEELSKKLMDKKIRLEPLISFYNKEVSDSHMFILNYSGLDTENLKSALTTIKELIV